MYAGLSGAVGRSQAGRCGGSSVAGLDVVPLADGRCVEIRPVSRADAQRLHAFVRALSPATRYRRFHGAIHELTPAMVDFLTDVDQRAHVALIALAGSAPVAEARYIREGAAVPAEVVRRPAAAGPASADIAIAVADDWQGIGLGTRLLRSLAASARANGIATLKADVLPDNVVMIGLLQRLGWRMRSDPEDPRSVIARLDLQGQVPAGTYM